MPQPPCHTLGLLIKALVIQSQIIILPAYLMHQPRDHCWYHCSCCSLTW